MKKLLQLSLILFSLILFSCDKNNDNNDDDEINMKAGYSYYRVTNYTDSIVKFSANIYAGSNYININLKSKEKYVFEISTTLGVNEIMCYVGSSYVFDHDDNENGQFDSIAEYAISDRTLTEIGIRKKE